MANSLRAKIKKLRHDGHITDAEYQAFIKKMDGHDAEIRNKAIDEFVERMKEKWIEADDLSISSEFFDFVDEIAEEMRGVKNE